MENIRTELLIYGRACEHLLATTEQSALSEEEKSFLLYYLQEVARKFEQQRSGITPYPSA